MRLRHCFELCGDVENITYKAMPRCISMKIRAEMRYKGWRPNSSLKAAVASGMTPNPSGYTLRPIVAWNIVHKLPISSGSAMDICEHLPVLKSQVHINCTGGKQHKV